MEGFASLAQFVYGVFLPDSCIFDSGGARPLPAKYTNKVGSNYIPTAHAQAMDCLLSSVAET